MLKYCFFAVIFFLSVPAVAQTVEQDGPQDRYSVATERAQDIFLKYQMAMDAEAVCNKQTYSPDDLMAMNKAAAAEMGAVSPQIFLGAARLLNLRRKAEDDLDKLVWREGCDGQKVKQSLAFYGERLANAHPVPALTPAAAAATGDAGAAEDSMTAPVALAPTGNTPSAASIADTSVSAAPLDDQVPGSGSPVVLIPTAPAGPR